MELLFYIPTESLLETYGRVRALLNSHDEIIFNAMAEATASTLSPFTPPASLDAGQVEQAHQEITKRLDFLGLRDGPLIAIKLMDEVIRNIKKMGSIPGLPDSALFDAVSFETTQNVHIKPNDDFHWFVAWPLSFSFKTIKQDRKIILDIYKKEWNEIIPSYIAQYISSAIILYRKGMDAASIALISISVEATLRDVLEAHGYTYIPGSSPVDVYKYSEADVHVAGSSYTITFRGRMPKSTADFHLSTGGNTPLIKIRRVDNRQAGRVDLNIIAPTNLVDHWSSDEVAQPAMQSVNGLGSAFKIARSNNIILTSELPLDFDAIIGAVRNNLIHLSQNALRQSIPSSLGSHTSLEAFLNDPVRVFDLITTVPDFINAQYIKLRRAGHLLS